MNFYDYYNFIQEVNKARLRLSKDFDKARMTLTKLQNRLNDELAARL